GSRHRSAGSCGTSYPRWPLAWNARSWRRSPATTPTPIDTRGPSSTCAGSLCASSSASWKPGSPPAAGRWRWCSGCRPPWRAPGGDDQAAAKRAAVAAEGRLRARLPNAVVGKRNGLSVWLLPRDPLPQLLSDCAAGERVAFGLSHADEDVPLSRAVEEAVEAAYRCLDLAHDHG